MGIFKLSLTLHFGLVFLPCSAKKLTLPFLVRHIFYLRLGMILCSWMSISCENKRWYHFILANSFEL